MATGDFCLVPSDVRDIKLKTAKTRGEIAVALMSIGNAEGDVAFINTRTMRKIIRNQFTVIPTPQSVIDLFNNRVGNPVAARRRNPVYPNLREVLQDEVHSEQLSAEKIAPAANPVVCVHRDTPDDVDAKALLMKLPPEHIVGTKQTPAAPREEIAANLVDPITNDIKLHGNNVEPAENAADNKIPDDSNIAAPALDI